jgi:hypothetical protein
MRVALLWFVLAFANVAVAKTPYEMKDVVLLQPDSVLQERTSANALAAYIRSVNAAAADIFAGQEYEPAGGFLVLAIRPGNQSAVWLDIHPALSPNLARALVARLRAIPRPAVEVGPVVFAIRTSLWGGTPPANNMPSPEEWTQEAKKAGRPLETGELVERIWPR